jgi:aminoglycoside 3-N-acetyltransferase
MIHTSMKAVGEVEGGADTVIDAFRDYLSEGLFLVPTHTWATVCADRPYFDVRTDLPCIGILPKCAVLRQGKDEGGAPFRSLHPTHSVCAWGMGAKEFIAGEEHSASPAGVGFLWDRLGEMGAKILLIGVGHDKNTFIHSVEERANVSDRLAPRPAPIRITAFDGSEITGQLRPHRCSRSRDVSENYPNFEPALIACGAQAVGILGGAKVRVVDAAKCREVILRILSRAEEDLCIKRMELSPELWER